MKIAVYSGSFNPLHKGHEAIIRFLTREAGFDKVYLVVTPQNPFKDRHSLPAGKDRFDAALAAVRRHPDLNVQVEDVELHMTPPRRSIPSARWRCCKSANRRTNSPSLSVPITWPFSMVGAITSAFLRSSAWRFSRGRAIIAVMPVHVL